MAMDLVVILKNHRGRFYRKLGIHFNSFNMASITSYNDIDSSFTHQTFNNETTMHEVFYRDNGKWVYETDDFVLGVYNKKITNGLEQLFRLGNIFTRTVWMKP